MSKLLFTKLYLFKHVFTIVPEILNENREKN